jgi:6-phosphofructokinase 1
MTKADLDFTIATLGECRFPSPMCCGRFTEDDERVLYASTLRELEARSNGDVRSWSMELAGPRRQVYFDPATLACGIVTCGGLCPGLNDVIRAIVLSLNHHYGVTRVVGFRFGYAGLVERGSHEPLDLTPEGVNRIHESGGSVLGSSRGPQDVAEMVTRLQKLRIGILFTIGGDGTLRGAQKISEEAARQGLQLSVVGIPKTIDNDVSFVQKTFGFETAVSEARRALDAANTEAVAAKNGIGLVKLMGRDSGFIAAHVVLADGHVNFCLVPEVPFRLEAFLSALEQRLAQREHAVIVVAEGAGQELMPASGERDASGNVKSGDVGAFLRRAIKDHFQRRGIPASVRYIDPSYTIRSVPASSPDSAFCLLLGQGAVHAGMSGRTNMVVGFWNHHLTHVPIPLAVSARKKIDPDGLLWNSVLASTGQPRDMR